MSQKRIQDILPLVESPSRYLGNEINVSRKNWNDVKLHMALAFPDLYEIGTSHFGLQILYNILNETDDVLAERVFTPAVDMEEELRSSNLKLSSLESSTALDKFDIIGFSLLYELNYTNVLNMLSLSHIPFLQSERDDSHPFIIAGGPCTFNPEPVAAFFDCIVIGDGEQAIVQLADAWMEWRSTEGGTRKDLLKQWSSIKGVYIPSFFDAAFDKNGYQQLVPEFESCQYVKRAVISDLNKTCFPDQPVVPFSKPIHDRLRLEISRGCTRGCRFCQAGMIYRPVRERAPEQLVEQAKTALKKTGYEDLSLLSLSTGDYGCIAPLIEQIMNYGDHEHVAVSLPSLRAGTITEALMGQIKKVRKTGFTIAPEAGSQRLRDVINKNITEDDVIGTVKNAFNMGWKVIKLYFMIGLPTETDEDIEAIVHLVKKIKTIRGDNGQSGNINVSVTTFIPKSHTPFQRAAQISLEASKQKIAWLKENLKIRGVRFKWQDPEVSMIEGIWARGDRKLTESLILAHAKGARFDGWTDHFNFNTWMDVFTQAKVDTDFYTKGYIERDAQLPWQHIHTGITDDFLNSEWEKAINEKPTGDCRDGKCHQCGICDFKRIQPVIFDSCRIKNEDIEAKPPEIQYKKTKVFYEKKGKARFFGHLELAKIFIRAIKRSGIQVKYSQGFHPMPKISFDDPLPMGMESLEEKLFITIPSTVQNETIVSNLNQNLPEGLLVLKCEDFCEKKKTDKIPVITYSVKLNNGCVFDKSLLKAFDLKDALMIEKKTKKGRKKRINLKEYIKFMKINTPGTLTVEILKKDSITVRPSVILSNVFDFGPDSLKRAHITKEVTSQEVEM